MHPSFDATAMLGRAIALVALVVSAGCASRAGPEDPIVEAASFGGADAAAQVWEETVFQGGWQVGGGVETPIYGGCDGFTFSTSANAWDYTIPNGSIGATISTEGTSAAPTPVKARICVFGLKDGTSSVVGDLPLELQVAILGERSMQIFVHPGNAPSSAAAEVRFEVTVQPKG